MKIKILTLLILTLHSFNLSAQIFDNSQAHFRVKWKQIDHIKFRLIFPEEFSPAAPTLATQIDHFIEKVSHDMNRKPKKISIIVQGNHIIQNGFVQLAPRKSELFPTPSGIADNQEWLPNLALHESRHFLQFDNLTGKIKGPLFEQLALAFFGIHLPSWYFEGDAVVQETLFSKGGRGRLASWNMPVRANIQSGLDFSFNKYVHGSFKDIVPSFYTIGYLMTSELYEKDSLMQGKILDDMNGKLLRPFSFQKSLKKFSGSNSKGVFKETMQHLKEKWSPHTIAKTEADSFHLSTRYPTDYLLPQYAGGDLYALEQGRQLPSRIVRISDKKNKHILYTGQQLMPYFDIKGDLIVWDELRRDSRFEKQSYHVVNIHDLSNGKTKTLTHETRYYTPTLSPDLKQVACVEVNLENNSSLIFLDIKNGLKIDSIVMPIGLHIQQPQYNPEGSKIVCIGVDSRGTNLLEFDLRSKTYQALLDWSNFQLERPIYVAEKIAYKANYNDKDDIYMLTEGYVLQCTDSQFGAFNPSVYSDTAIVYNNYSTNGYKIATKAPYVNEQAQLHPSHTVKAEALYPFQNMERRTLDSAALPNYSIEPYNVTGHSFNFHSLTLSGNDFSSFDNLRPGIFWLSNDLLNTVQTRLGYEYDLDIRQSIYSADVTYQRYYPKLHIGYTNRGQIGQAIDRNNNTASNFEFREHMVTADIQLPFVKYRRNMIYTYGVNMGTYYLSRYNISMDNLQNFNTEIAFPLNYQIYFNRNMLRSTMDIAPRWGQNFSFTYRHLPFENEISGQTWSLRSSLYFPGVLLNHSLQVRFGMQENSGRFIYSNDIPVVNGFAFFTSGPIKNTLLFDYRLPIAYPDWSIGGLAYIKRVRAVLSADYQNLGTSAIAPKTYGAGLSVDLNLFKYPLPNFALSGKATYINVNHAKQKLVPTFSFNYTY